MNQELVEFARKLEKSVIETVEAGKMTKDLAMLVNGQNLERKLWLTTEEFIETVAIKFSNS